ncbi:MAG: hypothetical protein EOP36_15680 [Rubrivivax sp.]|nr:MAG: hypothetical protein EOP36_15680 [Rubrivivax sp.]
MIWHHLVQALLIAKGITHLPHVSINLMLTLAVANDPFFQKVTLQFFKKANRRHPKFPLVRTFEYGFCVSHLKNGFENYYSTIEPSARRNQKKAERLGYVFEKIDYNAHLTGITDIRRSSTVRQGKAVPAQHFQKQAAPIQNPPSQTRFHDYPYFGILKDGKIVAFAACLVAGEICQIEEIFGHTDHQADGIVPMLIIQMARHISAEYPQVAYFCYGNHYGASDTMKRFKKKLGFVPHKVSWKLND